MIASLTSVISNEGSNRRAHETVPVAPLKTPKTKSSSIFYYIDKLCIAMTGEKTPTFDFNDHVINLNLALLSN
jgi:hypothetical protein